MKRDGRTIAVAVLRDMNFNKESNHHVANFLRQHKFLTGLVKRLDTDAEAVSRGIFTLSFGLNLN